MKLRFIDQGIVVIEWAIYVMECDVEIQFMADSRFMPNQW